MAMEDEALWLTLAPAKGAKGPVCLEHAPAPTKPGRGGKRPPQRFESEHRPSTTRNYFVKGPALSGQAKAYALHADGSSEELALTKGPQPKVTFKTPFNSDPLHGGNNIYVVDQQVKDGVLIVRVAKWLTIHHRCAWGHDHRHNPQRLTSQKLDKIPLEIVVDGLWDGNFHVRTRSGEPLDIQVLANGLPQPDALVTISTEKQWFHESFTGPAGISRVQLIKDYYPKSWDRFKRNQL